MRPLTRCAPAWAFLLLATVSFGESLPVDTEIQLRLLGKVASASKAGDKVETVVIAPVVVDNRVLIPAGSRVGGTVKAAVPARADARAELALGFTELAWPSGRMQTLTAKLIEVDNAREAVGPEGKITGILESDTLTARMDKGLERLGARYARFADILGAMKGAVLKKADTEISYDPGVEMRIALTQPLDLEGEQSLPDVEQITPADELEALVNALPFRTTAEKPPKPSDLTNLMYIGAREQLEAAFAAAGWTTAEKLNALTGLETFRAVVEERGYKEAPMSTLLLEGQKPDIVFQKQNNTFAKRHHLRIFQRPERFQGREVWVCAATHDIGIEFSPENRTFIHKIDPLIDKERAKVFFDLLCTEKVKAIALVDRPTVPVSTGNATGDKIETDGKMAVLLLR